MTVSRYIPLKDIQRRSDARAIDRANVDRIKISIAEVGLLSPVVVRPLSGDAFELIAGNHRFLAVQELGEADILAIEVDKIDDLRAEMAMIDENLIRAELTASEWAGQTARRKAIYLELHPETAHGGDRKSDQVANSATRSFADETAAISGQSARTVRQDAERGEKIAAAALGLIKGTKLDTGVYLDKLKRVPQDKQVEKVKADLAAPEPERKSNSQGGVAGRYQSGSSAPTPPVTFDDIRAALETLCQLKAEDFQKLCPPTKRPAMHQRMDRLITVFEQVKEAVSA
jgi:ParB/RepB/Spo0J family partition protein